MTAIKNTQFGFFRVMFVVALAVLTALFFAPIAFASETGMGDFGGSAWDSGSYDVSSWDSGSYDVSAWDSGSYDVSSWDSGSYDVSPWDSGSYNVSPYDSGSYNVGAWDSGSYNVSPFDSGSYNVGMSDTYDIYDVYDVYDVYTIQDGVAYSERPYFTPSYSTPSYSQPFSFRAPSTYYAPSYPAPAPRPVQQQQQQQQQQQGGGQPINIVNTNNNVNTNTNVNTAPVTPVYQAPVTYPVQYVYPQQPVYPTYPTYPTQNTYCVITASPSSVMNGQAAYLSWSSSGATSAWLSDGIGAVAVNGSLAVRPNNSKMYTLTVSGYGGTNTCSTYVTVQGSYISLSQIPYTGFDAGLLGNALYWLSLISFAVAGAYLTVYYLPRNVFGTGRSFAFVGGSMRASRKQNAVAYETVKIPEESKVEVVETPVETMTPSPIDVMEFLPVASVAHSTKDAMQVLPSNDGGAPRIVITRS